MVKMSNNRGWGHHICDSILPKFSLLGLQDSQVTFSCSFKVQKIFLWSAYTTWKDAPLVYDILVIIWYGVTLENNIGCGSIDWLWKHGMACLCCNRLHGIESLNTIP